MPSTDREARAGSVRGPRPDLLTMPTTRGAPIVTHSVVKSRAQVIDLAAWRRMRNHPGAGDWFGGRAMWSWMVAEGRWSV
jgi:hypothetical protein